MVNIRQPNGFLEVLPRPNITNVVFGGDVKYDHGNVVGSQINIISKFVPAGQVYVITDVYYYAAGPGSGMNVAPISLSAAGVAGLLRFELLFANRTPGDFTTSTRSPYSTAAATAAQSTQAGWSWLNQVFGAQRAAGFALYAKEQEEVLVRCTVDDIPRFPLSKVGTTVHGFSMPQGMFEEIWKR